MTIKKDKPVKNFRPKTDRPAKTDKPVADKAAAPIKPKVNTTVYVSNLSYKRDVVGVKKLFSSYGKVKKIKIVFDLETEKSKGMAFVEMATVAEAKTAIENLNGEVIDGRTLKASWAIPQEKPSFRIFEEDFEKKTAYRNSTQKPLKPKTEKKPFLGAFKKSDKKASAKKKGKNL